MALPTHSSLTSVDRQTMNMAHPAKDQEKDLTHAQVQTLRKWLRDLRYGGYSQTQERLRSSDGFCCLGVACISLIDAVPPDNYRLLSGWVIRPSTSHYSFLLEGEPFDTLLPLSYLKALGLTPGQQIWLSCLNDTYRCSFSDIADQLEEWFPSLKDPTRQ